MKTPARSDLFSRLTAAPRHEGVALLGDPGASLLAQIAWFNRMRFGAVTGMFLLTVAAAYGDVIADAAPLLVLTGITLLTNLAYLRWYRSLQPSRPRALRRHVDVQIGVDLLILTTMLHFSGGVTNPLVLSYLFHTFIASFLLSLRAASLVALVSIVLMAGLAVGEASGVLPHHELRIPVLSLQTLGTRGLAIWLATIALVLGLSVYFVSTIVRQLQARDRELLGLSRQLATSEKLASIGTLAAGVSHEINNPVGVIRNKAQVLRYRIQDGDPADLLLRELDTIDKHTRRIGAITEGLLTFSRETPFERRPLRVNELVQEGADLVRVPFKSAEIGLDLRLDPSDPEVDGSVNHLLQVLVNVLLNARDASPTGSRVVIATLAEPEHVRIAIRDRGDGIDPEHLPKIFDPFFTTKDVDKGTGLGLALSHGIVERHEGRIEVESVPGEGAEFTVVLPRRLGG